MGSLLLIGILLASSALMWALGYWAGRAQRRGGRCGRDEEYLDGWHDGFWERRG